MVSFDDCEGNPGCLTFMMESYKLACFRAEYAFARMIKAGIKGSKLYQLWNDCCGRDTEFALEVMENYDIEEIKRHIEGNGCYGEHFTREKANEQ